MQVQQRGHRNPFHTFSQSPLLKNTQCSYVCLSMGRQLSLQGTCRCRQPFAVNGQFLVVTVSGWSGIKCDSQEAQFWSLWVFSFISESLGHFPAQRQPKCLRAVLFLRPSFSCILLQNWCFLLVMDRSGMSLCPFDSSFLAHEQLEMVGPPMINSWFLVDDKTAGDGLKCGPLEQPVGRPVACANVTSFPYASWFSLVQISTLDVIFDLHHTAVTGLLCLGYTTFHCRTTIFSGMFLCPFDPLFWHTVVLRCNSTASFFFSHSGFSFSPL